MGEQMEMPRNHLWTAADLAAYLGLKESTVTALCSRAPERLPPRVSSLQWQRWHPAVVEQWARDHSRPKRRTARRVTPAF